MRALELGLALCSSAALAACGQPARGPNVLLITIDTLRADHLGCYGFERGTSPHIDALARESVVFEQSHSSAPWTLPALASLHTSLSTSAHGCDRIETSLAAEYETLAELLRNAGWDTALVACHVFLGGTYGLQQGFTHVDEDLITTAGDFDRSISSPGVSDRGLRFLELKSRASDGSPWFLWLHYFDPHADYVEHAGFSERFGTERDFDLYDGEIAFTDHHVGRVLRGLDELGLADDTLVVLTADHGEEFGDHGDWRHGTNLYQEVIRVPLLVRAPGLAPRRVRDTVGTVDVMPTVLDLCGVGARRETEGASLLPLLRGEASQPREILMEVRWRAGQRLRGVRREHWKYCEYRLGGIGPDLLFDLDRDPLECDDLLVEDPARVAALRAHLERRQMLAYDLARGYPVPSRAEPAPADRSRLEDIGYVGGETEAPPEEPR